jgi:hypothetical protein
MDRSVHNANLDLVNGLLEKTAEILLGPLKATTPFPAVAE